jgi:hypothetical protein
MSSEDWQLCTDASTMLERLIAETCPSERELRLFSCACVRLTLEMVESLDEKARADATLIVDFVERTVEDELRPPPGSDLAELAEVAELSQDGWGVEVGGWVSPLGPDAKNAANLAIRYALGAYCEQQRRRCKGATDPELVRAIEERVKRAGAGLSPLSRAERVVVRLASLIGRGEALKSWLERPGAFDATTRASISRMADAEASAPGRERNKSRHAIKALCADTRLF